MTVFVDENGCRRTSNTISSRWTDDIEKKYGHPHLYKSSQRQQHFLASSAMPGSPQNLTEIASHVKVWGICYENRRPEQLPTGDNSDLLNNAYHDGELSQSSEHVN